LGDLGHLTEWTFDRKRISANPNSNLNLISNSNPSFKSNSNPKSQKRFLEIEMTSFFGKCPDILIGHPFE